MLRSYLSARTLAVLVFVVALAVGISKYANNDLSFGTARAYAGRGNLVSLYVDGAKRTVSTNDATVGDVLRDFNVALGQGDVVEPDTATPIDTANFNINVYRAKPVLIDDNGHDIRTLSGYQSPRQIATAAGLQLFPEDKVDMHPITDFTGTDMIGNKVVITRAKPVQVVLSGQTYNFRTQADTVAQLLAERHISVAPADLMSVQPTDPVEPGLRVVINKISQDVVTVNQPIPAPVQVVYDNNLPLGSEQVRQAGAAGTLQQTWLVNYKDQAETGRNLLDSKVLVPATAQIIVRGKKVADDVWLRLRQCESGNAYNRNSGNGYYGAYQFDLTTWYSNGGTGRPDLASPALQDQVARLTQARRGWGPWPVCSVKLDLH